MCTAIGYVRVSTEEQANSGNSLDAQGHRIRAYCIAAGINLAAIVREEGVSAKIPLFKRPQGSKLARLMRKHKAGAVVVMKLDRLFRSVEDALSTVRGWDKTGVGLHVVDMGGQAIATTSAVGKLFLTMLSGFAEFERELTGERIRATMQNMKAKGMVVGTVPLGWEPGDDGRLIPVESEQKVIRRIHAMRDTGSTLQAIADILTAEGVPTKRGGQWYPSTVRAILSENRYIPDE